MAIENILKRPIYKFSQISLWDFSAVRSLYFFCWSVISSSHVLFLFISWLIEVICSLSYPPVFSYYASTFLGLAVFSCFCTVFLFLLTLSSLDSSVCLLVRSLIVNFFHFLTYLFSAFFMSSLLLSSLCFSSFSFPLCCYFLYISLFLLSSVLILLVPASYLLTLSLSTPSLLYLDFIQPLLRLCCFSLR